MPQKTILLEWGGAAATALLALYKTELQAYFKAKVSHLKVFFQRFAAGRRLSLKEEKEILNAGLDGLDTLVWYLRDEYQCDRVTIVEYEKQDDGSRLATCLSEARVGGMPTVERDLQSERVHPDVWAELERIHSLEGHRHFVPDAHLVEIAAMRDALLKYGVYSGFYQSLPMPDGKCRALLSLSWHEPHAPLSALQLNALRLSGIACAYGVSYISRWKKTKKE